MSAIWRGLAAVVLCFVLGCASHEDCDCAGPAFTLSIDAALVPQITSLSISGDACVSQTISLSSCPAAQECELTVGLEQADTSGTCTVTAQLQDGSALTQVSTVAPGPGFDGCCAGELEGSEVSLSR